MGKIKHSKYRNTGLIFEILSRKMVSEVLSAEGNISSKIIKKYFNSTSELRKELKLYHTLINESERTETFAEKLIDVVLEIRRKLDSKKLESEKYKLISEIKRYYSLDDFFNSRVSKYKENASVYKLFENKIETEPVEYLQSRDTIKENIIAKKEGVTESIWDTEDSITKKLTLKLIIEKFNEKYQNLNSKQKELLSRYINTDIESNDFKTYIISEALDVTKKLQRKNITDAILRIKVNEICNLSEKIIASKFIKDEHLSALLKFYKLEELI